MLNELRVLIAETLFGWAGQLAPGEHKDGPLLVRTVAGYFDAVVARRRKASP